MTSTYEKTLHTVASFLSSEPHHPPSDALQLFFSSECSSNALFSLPSLENIHCADTTSAELHSNVAHDVCEPISSSFSEENISLLRHILLGNATLSFSSFLDEEFHKCLLGLIQKSIEAEAMAYETCNEVGALNAITSFAAKRSASPTALTGATMYFRAIGGADHQTSDSFSMPLALEMKFSISLLGCQPVNVPVATKGTICGTFVGEKLNNLYMVLNIAYLHDSMRRQSLRAAECAVGLATKIATNAQASVAVA